jgi:hypothetical protein
MDFRGAKEALDALYKLDDARTTIRDVKLGRRWQHLGGTP